MLQSRMDSLLAVVNRLIETEPMVADALALALGPARPRYGDVKISYQNGKITHAVKTETLLVRAQAKVA